MDWETNFSINTPTQVSFGWGCRNEFIKNVVAKGNQRILIIASSRMLQRPFISAFVNYLQNSNVDVRFFTNVSPNPRTHDIDACLSEFSTEDITHVLGIGGGSALDQAKATAMALHTGSGMATLLSSKAELPKRKIELSLMSTTSGTGAEVSFGAIVTDEENTNKTGLRGRNLAADYAYIDPELTLSCPRNVTMITGFDVLTHALETYLSRKANVYTTAFSEQAIKNVFTHLPTLYNDLSDKHARSGMAYASMLCGFNLALSTTCLPHRLQYPLGAETDTSHAEGLAALYPTWIEASKPYCEDKLAQCAAWVGEDKNDNDSENATNFILALLRLMEAIEMRRSLSDLGVNREMALGFVDKVSGNLSTDPGLTTKEAIKKIYINSL